MIKFYGYSKCSTVRKAKAWLMENNLEFENIEIVKNPPIKEELKEMYEVSGYELKKFFNTSGVKYRELGLKDVVKTETDEYVEYIVRIAKLDDKPLASNQ